MDVVVRPAVPEDAQAAGRICFEAFRRINTEHGFPPDFDSPDTTVGVLTYMISHPGFYVIVAERDGVILGSNALDERSLIAGVCPITVDPDVQKAGVGR